MIDEVKAGSAVGTGDKPVSKTEGGSRWRFRLGPLARRGIVRPNAYGWHLTMVTRVFHGLELVAVTGDLDVATLEIAVL